MTANDLREMIENQSTQNAILSALNRGNHIEIHSSKEGLKVFECGKKLIVKKQVNNK